MIKNLIKCFMMFFVLIFPIESYSAFTDKPGARPMGIGGAFVGIADDINSLFYNPAGIAGMKRTEITAMYDQQYIGIGDNLNYGYIGFVHQIGDLGTVGISGSQSYSDLYREYIGALSYGKTLTLNPAIYIGCNVKWFSRNIVPNEYTNMDPLFTDLSKKGISVDVGFLMFVTKKITLGMMFENINEPSIALGDYGGEILKMSGKVGCAFKLGGFTPVLEVNIKNRKVSNKVDVNVLGGIEYKLSDDMDLRLGGNLYNITSGLSYRTSENLYVDYAFRYPITGLIVYGSHTLQLTYKFGSVKPTKPLTKVIITLPSGVKKMSIAVLDLEANNVSSTVSSIVSEFLRFEFFKSQRYDIVERKNMDKILKEQVFQYTGCTSSECAVEIGKILNVHYVVVGSVNKIGNQYIVQTRLVDVEKARVVLADMAECDSEEKLSSSVKELIERFNNQISIAGKIMEVNQDTVLIDKGSIDKIENDMILNVEREIETMREEIAIIRIIEVNTNTSKGKIIEKKKKVENGDIVNLGSEE